MTVSGSVNEVSSTNHLLDLSCVSWVVLLMFLFMAIVLAILFVALACVL